MVEICKSILSGPQATGDTTHTLETRPVKMEGQMGWIWGTQREAVVHAFCQRGKGLWGSGQEGDPEVLRQDAQGISTRA